MMKRIFLIGYMGAGKTTVGKALSKELTYEECMEIINGQSEKPASRPARRRFTRK